MYGKRIADYRKLNPIPSISRTQTGCGPPLGVRKVSVVVFWPPPFQYRPIEKGMHKS